jgi:hypothetical protein
MKKVLLIFGIIFIIFCSYLFYLKNYRDSRLINEGNEIVIKVEDYRSKYNRLPSSLNEIGIVEKEGVNALYYSIKDSLSENYIIWFGTSLGESKIYYSDTKQWENGYREMNR